MFENRNPSDLDHLIEILRVTEDEATASDLMADRSPDERAFLLDHWRLHRGLPPQPRPRQAVDASGLTYQPIPQAVADVINRGDSRVYTALVNLNVARWLLNAHASMPAPDPRWPDRFIYRDDARSPWAHFVAGLLAIGVLNGRARKYGKYFELDRSAVEGIARFLNVTSQAIREI